MSCAAHAKQSSSSSSQGEHVLHSSNASGSSVAQELDKGLGEPAVDRNISFGISLAQEFGNTQGGFEQNSNNPFCSLVNVDGCDNSSPKVSPTADVMSSIVQNCGISSVEHRECAQVSNIESAGSDKHGGAREGSVMSPANGGYDKMCADFDIASSEQGGPDKFSNTTNLKTVNHNGVLQSFSIKGNNDSFRQVHNLASPMNDNHGGARRDSAMSVSSDNLAAAGLENHAMGSTGFSQHKLQNPASPFSGENGSGSEQFSNSMLFNVSVQQISATTPAYSSHSLSNETYDMSSGYSTVQQANDMSPTRENSHSAYRPNNTIDTNSSIPKTNAMSPASGSRRISTKSDNTIPGVSTIQKLTGMRPGPNYNSPYAPINGNATNLNTSHTVTISPGLGSNHSSYQTDNTIATSMITHYTADRSVANDHHGSPFQDSNPLAMNSNAQQIMTSVFADNNPFELSQYNNFMTVDGNAQQTMTTAFAAGNPFHSNQFNAELTTDGNGQQAMTINGNCHQGMDANGNALKAMDASGSLKHSTGINGQPQKPLSGVPNKHLHTIAANKPVRPTVAVMWDQHLLQELGEDELKDRAAAGQDEGLYQPLNEPQLHRLCNYQASEGWHALRVNQYIAQQTARMQIGQQQLLAAIQAHLAQGNIDGAQTLLGSLRTRMEQGDQDQSQQQPSKNIGVEHKVCIDEEGQLTDPNNNGGMDTSTQQLGQQLIALQAHQSLRPQHIGIPQGLQDEAIQHAVLASMQSQNQPQYPMAPQQQISGAIRPQLKSQNKASRKRMVPKKPAAPKEPPAHKKPRAPRKTAVQKKAEAQQQRQQQSPAQELQDQHTCAPQQQEINIAQAQIQTQQLQNFQQQSPFASTQKQHGSSFDQPIDLIQDKGRGAYASPYTLVHHQFPFQVAQGIQPMVRPSNDPTMPPRGSGIPVDADTFAGARGLRNAALGLCMGLGQVNMWQQADFQPPGYAPAVYADFREHAKRLAEGELEGRRRKRVAGGATFGAFGQ
ncbi:hypothetical protein GQ43DRAFT_496491 [Delitschia confertaspora ATCC 74209]|uniref:Uncharacterized protein n=1 Tax=Delitschia confertaspora ATCC 74209 TaxID=1513339 RepID=A0A9P4JWZ1_9PLEO|nr:hypothetical protein GQ43DRAFT_496491 [Delitschia confertaspora ATCC 74209]